MNDQWRIARATTDEAPIIVRLVSRLLTEVAAAPLPMPEDEATGLCLAMMGEGDYFPILAYSTAQPAGVLCLGRGQALYAGGEFGIIEELYIAPEFRGEGLGRRLIAHAELVAKEKHWKRLEVGAPRSPRGDAAILFYENSGFNRLGPRLFKALGE